ncbi:MAG TPA: hypothetical protein VLH38_03300 [Patescibacteria group bacterium]|nr:hypothetical protein [Patescibacteria group bacterium]
MQNQIKPGYKTTEFWVTLLVTLAASVLPFVTDLPKLYSFLSIVVAAGTALGYTAARTSAKNN